MVPQGKVGVAKHVDNVSSPGPEYGKKAQVTQNFVPSKILYVPNRSNEAGSKIVDEAVPSSKIAVRDRPSLKFAV